MSASGSFNYQLAQPPPLCLTDLLFINKRLRCGVTKLSTETAEQKARGGKDQSQLSSVWFQVSTLAGKELGQQGAPGIDGEDGSRWDGGSSWGWQEKKTIKDVLLLYACVFLTVRSNTNIITLSSQLQQIQPTAGRKYLGENCICIECAQKLFIFIIP